MRIDHQKTFGTKPCPGCAVDIAENENRCPICGYPFADPHHSPLRRHAALIAILVLIAFLLPLFLALR